MKTCSKCNENNPGNQYYCVACGAKLVQSSKPHDASMVSTKSEVIPSTQRNQDLEKELNHDYGLTFRGNGWTYAGTGNMSLASTLNNPELCLEVVQQLRKKLDFNQVCIVGGTPQILVCKSTPPFGVQMSLISNDIAKLIVLLAKNYFEHQGVWIITLK